MKRFKFQFYVGLGLVGLTLYDVFKTSFELKHAIFLGIAALAVYQGFANQK